MLNKSISITILGLLFLAGITTANAQIIYQAKASNIISLVSSDGTNASSLVWNPDKKIYYSVIAGNEDFPLETYDENGKFLFTSSAAFDTRGLWYNPKSKKLEGNGAGENGFFSHDLTSSGQINGSQIKVAGQNQPEFNSVGAFYSKKKLVYFYSEGMIYSYKAKGGKQSKSFAIQIPSSLDVINPTTVVFTGRKGQELGLLDFDAAKVYLFDLKGKHTATVNLPIEYVSSTMFRFSFTNDKIWLYDADERVWSSYSI